MALKGFKTIDYAALDVRRIGIGMLGYGFMGKVHSNAYLKIPYSFKSPAAYPELVAICGRDEARVADMAARLHYRGYYTDWKQMIKDPAIEIIDNVTPDDRHRAPSIAAAEAGKHVICEKPLAMTVRDASAMVEAVLKAGVKHMCCFNYRFFPAVRLAKELIETGALGKIYHFRGRYLQEPGHDPAAPLEDAWYASGTKSGILLGIGSHIIDMSRFLLGEIVALSGLVRTYNPTRTSRAGVVETRHRGRRKPGAGGVRQRRHGHARIVGRGHRAPQSAHLGDQRRARAAWRGIWRIRTTCTSSSTARRRRRCAASPTCRSPIPATRCRRSTSRSDTTPGGSTATSTRCIISWTASPKTSRWRRTVRPSRTATAAR